MLPCFVIIIRDMQLIVYRLCYYPCLVFLLIAILLYQHVQNCMTLSQWFSHFTLSSAPAHCFFTILKSHKAVWTGHKRTTASLAMTFSKTDACVQITKQRNNYYSRFLNIEIRLCAWRQGESLASIAESVFEESPVNDSSANTAYIYWGGLPVGLQQWKQTAFQPSSCLEEHILN